MPDDFVTEADLPALGLTPLLIRILAPHAVEYTALDGTPCWAVGDLDRLFADNGGGQ